MSRPPSQESTASASSYDSMLSDDSYLAKMKPVDAAFVEMMGEIKVLENNRRMFEERKVQSHIQKGRDPNDTERRENWTEKQLKDYANYKLLVSGLSRANDRATASEKVAKTKKDEESRIKALRDQKDRSAQAILSAEARLKFMTRYPNAFSTPSHKKHIKAVEDNLNSAKAAQKEVQTQLDKIAAAKEIQKRKAAAAAKQAAEESNGGKK